MAATLEMPKVIRLLNAKLKEELGAAKKIKAAAGPILKLSSKEPGAPKKPKTGKEKYAAKMSKEDEKEAAPDLSNHRSS